MTTTFVTMQKRADDIFTDSQFSAFMKQLETEDLDYLFENSTLSSGLEVLNLRQEEKLV